MPSPHSRRSPKSGGSRWLSHFFFLFRFPAFGQSYSIDWYKVSGGGGTSTGGTYQVSGTIGQPDAGGAMTGGSYSVTGGFWALYAVQTPGAPLLTITYIVNQAIVSWHPRSPAGRCKPTPIWPRHLGQLSRRGREQQRDQCTAQRELCSSA